MSEPIPDYAQGTNDSIHSFPGSSANPLPDVGAIGKLFTNLAESILKKVVMAIVGFVLPGPIVNQLAYWAQTLLPQQILQPIRDLINVIVTVLDLIPIIGPPAGDALEYFGQIFGVIKANTDTAQATGEAAQASADNANVGVARLEGKQASSDVPGGVLFDDTFNRSGPNLGPNYDQANTGPAGGTLSTDGNNAILIPSGSGNTYAYGRILTPLFTNYQAISVVQDSPFVNTLVFAEWTVGLRCNAARTDMVVFKVSVDSCAIGKVVGGTYTQLGSATEPNAAGDRWTFRVGTDVDDRHFQLFHGSSSTPVVDVIDSTGTLSNLGASHLFPIIGQYNALYFVPPFFTGQGQPPAMQSITAYDRLPAA